MTDFSDRRNYANQGQQDDYFEQDLAIAGQEPKTPTPPAQENQVALDEYTHQGQQDDHFDEDLTAGNRPST